MVKECGIIEVTSYRATLEDQTYEIDCGEDGNYPVGSKVRVRLEDTKNPLEIAEIYAYGDLGMSQKVFFLSKTLQTEVQLMGNYTLSHQCYIDYEKKWDTKTRSTTFHIKLELIYAFPFSHANTQFHPF